MLPVADGVAADIGSDGLEQARVVVAHRSNVQLHRPAMIGVAAAKVKHDVRAELLLFLRRGGGAGTSLIENGGGLGITRKIGVCVREAVDA